MTRPEHAPVTDGPNRYIISYCPCCETLYEATRRDQLTCSPACRVRAHRTGKLTELKRTADALRIHPALTLRSHAVEILRPDLAQKIAAGEVEYDDILPDLEAAFSARVMKAVRMSEGERTE